MQPLPQILKGDRILDAVALPLLSIGQAILLGVGVFATREAFGALHGDTALPKQTLFKLIGAGLGAVFLELLRQICAERLGQSYANSLRAALYRHLAGMPKSALDERRIGALSLRFVGDLSAARNWFGSGLPRVVSAAIVLPGAGTILWMLDPSIAATGYLVVGITVLVMVIAALGFEAAHRDLRGRRANIAIAMMERIAIAPLLDLLGRTQRELSSLEEKGHQLRNDATTRAWKAGVLAAIPQIGVAFAGAAVLWQAARLNLSPGTVAASLAMLGILTLPLRELAQSWDRYSAWRIAREKALNLFAQKSALRQPQGLGTCVVVSALGKLGKQEFNLTIPAGATAWLRGGTVSDRSRLALFLAGLDDHPDIEVRYGNLPTYFPRIHFIGDTPLALQGSLRRTLTLGISPRPDGKTIVDIARALGLHDLMRQGRRALKSRIAEAARNVSPAESLRLEMVRAILANPDVVVIDTARLFADPDPASLIRNLSEKLDSTIIVNDRKDTTGVPFGIEEFQIGERCRDLQQ